MIKLNTYRMFRSPKRTSNHQSLNEAYRFMCHMDAKKTPSADLAQIRGKKNLNFVQKVGKFFKSLFYANKTI